MDACPGNPHDRFPRTRGIHETLTGNPGTHDPTLIDENGTWREFQTAADISGKLSRKLSSNLNWDPDGWPRY